MTPVHHPVTPVGRCVFFSTQPRKDLQIFLQGQPGVTLALADAVVDDGFVLQPSLQRAVRCRVLSASQPHPPN